MNAAALVFCDIVRFSGLGSPEQERLFTKLNSEVTHELYGWLNTRDREPRVVCLPTGDGLAVAFLDGDSACAAVFGLVSRLMTWKERERVQIRIGVHLGRVTLICDINRNVNVCGNAINMCQRIMDAANPGQVLVSEEARRDWIGDLMRSTEAPFSEAEPAFFSEPYTIVAKHSVPLNVCIAERC